MKISIIGIRAYPADFVGTSGVEKYTFEVVKMLVSQKFSFRVYTRKKYQKKENSRINEQVQIVPLTSIQHKFFESLFYSFYASILTIFDKSYMVWYHGLGPALFCWIPRIFGKKVVVTVHSLDWKRKKWTGIERYVFSNLIAITRYIPHQYTVVSSRVQEELKDIYKIFADLTVSGLDEELKINTQLIQKYLRKYSLLNKPYLLFIGRFVPEKRLEWLLKGFIALKHRFPHLRLVIAGGSSYTDRYIQSLKNQYRHPAIQWLPYVSGTEKFVLLQKAQALIIPSELEGLPISALEMLSQSGQVVIAKDCIDQEFLKLKNVYTFKTSSYQSFIFALIESVTHARRKGLQVTAIQKKYSWKKTARIFSQLFTEL